MTSLSSLTNQSLPKLERILVIGSGGRENALAWALSKCPEVTKIWVAPGNGGTQNHIKCECIPIKETDAEALISFSSVQKINLIIIGPEAPLAKGIANILRKADLTVFGPCEEGALLESSKIWAKELMKEARIPTANYWETIQKSNALEILKNVKKPLVVKVDGLAAGKGVAVPESIEETENAINEVFEGKFGLAGKKVLLEEKLKGPEVSVFAICDGENFSLLPPAQDHKRLKESDLGPNTGGMGAYAPASLINDQELIEISDQIIQPTLEALKKRGIDYRGVIYAGLMITDQGPKVIEFNCRFGDPECQALMPLMGDEFAKVLQACALGCLEKAPKLSIKPICSACVVSSVKGYPEAPRKGDTIHIPLFSQANLYVFHAGTKLINENNLLTDGGRVLATVGVAKDFDEAFKTAYKGMEEIFFDGMHYRKDIGKQVRSS